MADNKKKMAAALSAVSTYLQQEEEAAALQAQAAELTSAPCEYGLSQWSHSGRQEMMSMRRLIQLRAFDRFR
ncbi:hypothetical protein [Desulfopila sp. IMCC35008]|uniref:hypothetical protein n=1 Tax=Desulfopila sp. IMCC35008 TaxID=2653858 RepID=UPI0013D66779|nr:hypothetical protein [Desulfopila sp. IMCC35008]